MDDYKSPNNLFFVVAIGDMHQAFIVPPLSGEGDQRVPQARPNPLREVPEQFRYWTFGPVSVLPGWQMNVNGPVSVVTGTVSVIVTAI